MRWFDPEDRSEAVITAAAHVTSGHGTSRPPVLPEVCVLFEMGRALDQLRQDYPYEVISEHLPCFLDNPPCLRLRDAPHVCFTKGGYGAPAAVDTLETVLALGVKKVIVAGSVSYTHLDVYKRQTINLIDLKVITNESADLQRINKKRPQRFWRTGKSGVFFFIK